MKLSKQKKVLEILASGRYKVENGEVFTFRGGEWRVLGVNPLKGYYQYHIFNGVRNGKGLRARVYKHVLVYLATFGTYPEGFTIDHRDRNKDNNHPDNLRAGPHSVNMQNTDHHVRCTSGGGVIRGEEIKNIRALHADGFNQSQIARQLGLNRISVRYIVKKIEAGEPLKFEDK